MCAAPQKDPQQQGTDFAKSLSHTSHFRNLIHRLSAERGVDPVKTRKWFDNRKQKWRRDEEAASAHKNHGKNHFLESPVQYCHIIGMYKYWWRVSSREDGPPRQQLVHT